MVSYAQPDPPPGVPHGWWERERGVKSALLVGSQRSLTLALTLLWNDGNPTYTGIHPATCSVSAIDISVCSHSLLMVFELDIMIYVAAIIVLPFYVV